MPANEIVGLLPGELFVHRNVANVVVHTDLNCLSVMQFAVDVLQGRAHHRVRALRLRRRPRGARPTSRSGLIDNWLRHVQDVADRHAAMLAALDERRARRSPVRAQRRRAGAPTSARTTIVQDAWQRGQTLTVHGWVYGISDGLVKDLRVEADSVAKLEADYQAALAAVARSGR